MTVARRVVLTDDAGKVIHTGTAGVVVENVAGWRRSAPLQHDRVKRWGHGSFAGQTTREGRSYVVRGVTSGMTEVEALAEQRRVLALFAGLGEGVLQVADDAERSAVVRLDGEILADDEHIEFGWFRWEIPLWADDAYRYGPPRRVLLHPVGSGVGLVYPLFSPVGVLSYGSAVNVTQVLTNAGDAPAYPVFDVQVDDPSGFRVVMDGRVVEYGGPCVAGATVTVDMAGSVAVDGVGMGTMLRRREWASIPPNGSSTAVLETLQGGVGSAWATVRDTWI